MLRLFILHQQQTAIERLIQVRQQLEERIEWGTRTQLMLQSTSKGFPFNHLNHNF
jgi:hypothetical protein